MNNLNSMNIQPENNSEIEEGKELQKSYIKPCLKKVGLLRQIIGHEYR